jgi:hypothetical protein
MADPPKDDQRPFAFWLIETFLPPDDEAEEHEAMSDRGFYIGLALSLALVVAVGASIRGCTI